jgi:hypothetical protein
MAIVINGSGTVTGISVGGLPDGIVDAGTVAADVATQAEIDAKLALAGGTLTGNLAFSSDGEVSSTAGYMQLKAEDTLYLHYDTDGGGSENLVVRSGSGATERMRIDSSGDVLVGMGTKTETVSTNAAAYFAPTGSSNEYATLYIVHNSAQKHGIVMKDMNTGGGPQLDFRNSLAAQVGSISANASATTYATSSDHRLKENVDYTWDATTRLKQLKPARFNFIVDDTNTLVDGFIAHEVSSVVPEAITGTKDAMTTAILYTAEDEETQGDSPTKSVGDVKEASKPDHQGIDQSKLVPLLVKTIQELEARITALEA